MTARTPVSYSPGLKTAGPYRCRATRRIRKPRGCRVKRSRAMPNPPSTRALAYAFASQRSGPKGSGQFEPVSGDFVLQAISQRLQAIANRSGLKPSCIAAMPARWVWCRAKRWPGRLNRLGRHLSSSGKRTTLVAFGTEAGLFKNAGIPTVVCGPGSIAQAHQPDEYVSLEQLAQCQAFMHGLAATFRLG